MSLQALEGPKVHEAWTAGTELKPTFKFKVVVGSVICDAQAIAELGLPPLPPHITSINIDSPKPLTTEKIKEIVTLAMLQNEEVRSLLKERINITYFTA